MLLEITTTHRPATDLGYLLHKHPTKAQAFDLAFGTAHVYYPHATDERCTAALLLDVDPVALVRGRGVTLDQYVNDRPYSASSFLSTAISKVYGTALGGRCKDRPELVETAIPLEARLPSLPARGGVEVVRRMFEPLGYEVEAEEHPLDPAFPDWGQSATVSLTLRGTVRLADLLTHLYVLVPALDARKHYYVGDDEVEKLMEKGEGWLSAHPERELITRRYLRFRSLTRPALDRLAADDPVPDDDEAGAVEEAVEKPVRLNDQRMEAVVAAFKESGARRVVDLGCGEGRLMRDLVRDGQFREIVGVDVSVRALEQARDRLHLGEDAAPALRERVSLLHGSLVYRDARLAGFDAAAAVEVIEHLDPPRLAAFEQAVFGDARPGTVVVTTPNAEYNALWETLPAGRFRHPDHRFEWTRAEFQSWAGGVAERHGYDAQFRTVGPVDDAHGSPTQMGVFSRRDGLPTDAASA
ncbi:3' terminal RNA ribose 2'-O-methyltransferase Hen1 [Rubrivirga sp. S365]|uniref:3' terminal RNA ribose 2'-O-methyltransferase Hen1 n=1 Tax=Rubrivirga sp. S365 TaxID=3076080 RepID=UPI0028C94A92|nr:3' terminal RNA ribose 2'-O-methyltransferase Hen1 [Rubrivirga sp. S365]MDT7858424.1 3' terminal RNA ribose 2'-O-methyltransferase Hen1 [Rubrivirga sp. S365]